MQIIEIETTNRCNARCAMCPRDQISRPLGQMERALFKRIIDQAVSLKRTQTISFCGLGEPLLHPELPDWIAYIDGRFHTYLTTNGALLSEDRIRRLIDAGLDEISVSFNGITPQTFEHLMHPLDFNETLRNVERLVDLASDRLQVTINATISKVNQLEAEGFRDFWAQRGVHQLILSPCHSRGGGLRDPAIYDHRPLPPIPRCDLFATTTFVAWNGQVLSCCHDITGEQLVGDLRTEDLNDIAGRREIILRERRWFPICADCDDVYRFRMVRDGGLAAGEAARILVISHDVVGPRMGGTGIRYWELAKAIGRHQPVTLAVPNAMDWVHPWVEVRPYDPDGTLLRELVDQHDVILTQGFTFLSFPFLKDVADKIWILDLYCPFTLENLELHSTAEMDHREWTNGIDQDILNEQLRLGDFFLCASERQRDYWLGALDASGRVNPHTYSADKSLRRLVDVVPSGLPSEPPQHEKAALKGVWEGISPTDRVLFWGGGLWEWLDPLTPIRAMAQVCQARDDVRLFFMGGRHPNVDRIAEMPIYDRAVHLARDLGLEGRFVIFNDGWVPYRERENYLMEADAGLSAHFPFVESRLAFRTRLLDYIWAGLPIITTQGDPLSDLVVQEDLGHVVAPEDVDGWAQAILALLDEDNARGRRRERFATVARGFMWDQVAEPLVAFCQDPRPVADRDIARPTASAAVLRQHQARITDLERRVEQQKLELTDRDAVIRDLREHIARIRQGRIMRLLNTLDMLLPGRRAS